MIMDGISVEEFAEIRAEEAYAKGRSEGEQAGATQEKIEIAKKLIALGLSVEQITEATGLSPEEIESLQ